MVFFSGRCILFLCRKERPDSSSKICGDGDGQTLTTERLEIEKQTLICRFLEILFFSVVCLLYVKLYVELTSWCRTTLTWFVWDFFKGENEETPSTG